ncbi:type II secretion system F family protein [Candidatus Woesearchaeota archaeon]|nr:type II secretion system F family protein [Candidatus Woesearchaeota archaeon]
MGKILRYFIDFAVRENPKLDLQLKQANIKEQPESYISKSLAIALIISLVLSVPLFFILLKEKASLFYFPPMFAVFFIFALFIMLKLPLLIIKKRVSEIESDLLYSARYLLLKMRTGSPLMNALVDVSKLHTNSSKYFGEIVSDIYLGEPLEDAINNTHKTTPSAEFKRILRVIKDSLNTGVDIKENIELLLKEITEEQLVKIESYSKKINSLSLFYMIIGVIAPSLGISILAIGASFIKINITMGMLIIVFLVICLVQYFFITLFNAFKPKVSL